MNCGEGIDTRQIDELFINLDPIQAGGRLTTDAMKAVLAYGDGYSVCDHCTKPFRLDHISKPPLAEFHKDLATFLNMDTARLVPGARRGFQAVADALVKPDDPVLLTAYSHYTEFLSVEQARAQPFEIPANDSHIITPDAAASRIEEVIKTTGKTPALMFVEQVDYQYGNQHPVKDLIKVAHQYDIPVLCNGAYTIGIMEVDGKELGADFLVGSGHKSMAAPAPSGVLATTNEWAETVLRTTGVKGDLTGRTFGVKEVEMMGCTLMGVTSVGMMASFPHVKKRVKEFDAQVRYGNMIVDALLTIDGTQVQSEYPRRHTLTRMNTTDSFDKVAKKHKKKGFFLTSALRERGITGILAGSTRVWKFNSYGITKEQASYVADAFVEIAKAEGIA
ncbi:O-phospho-L-seryl-tRNA:Cys-tRNA synthase [Methanospirillum sp. J.3.6.1-F.2.7.3]|jgi:Sep-tRNA:Cys-tRNA synthetase|uniref:O-phospho-L-seryl-tRNA:Cys-tRNA synthase n=2 Tax=Methanospirillum TaxID=2202 RepID=A0A8E7EKJ5_9EURY|nr:MULTISPECIES: O-phospho-L-seryl-tRNA:Cys-tRNA synthase [Methanospirillum]MDX8550623.1 O-phospho-L-seryl-tRNA:Cys-tRNA synthase [Methanospirillum hungatei]QVV89776.1 O-phospho-L-seryl-tRNA:Cys-tRNA synthase [Methanospirillum sp. J.3.6.1-F.2.7.3]QXO95962.1 O-phospho-L-seryl-tRNA:Cys-tRNA synthase [Methanospirillum hungatei]